METLIYAALGAWFALNALALVFFYMRYREESRREQIDNDFMERCDDWGAL